MNIFFIHWNEEEFKEKIKPLKKAGHKVNVHFNVGIPADLKNKMPDCLIICLDRLPSHGKAFAAWLWEKKKRHHIPIVFCGGKPEKVEPIRFKFPKAIFFSNENLSETLSKLKIK